MGRLDRGVLWLFVAVFVFRLAFGLLHASWSDVDERQTYLIGLKSYTTGTWPYFGPDLNGSEASYESQLPGALLGLMIALPLRVLPIPEAPFVFLNLMSAAAIVLLAWYIVKRLPRLSLPWLGAWIAVAPWSLQLATHVYNPGYLLLPAVLFFIGLFEATPSLRAGVLSYTAANAWLGLSTFWVMQLHYSFVYMLPLAAFAIVSQARAGRGVTGAGQALLGAIGPLVFVVPTFLVYGISSVNAASGFTVPFNVENFLALPVIAARFLSMPSFELPRFLGHDTASRVAFLTQHWLLLVPGLALALAGLVQPIALLVLSLRSKVEGPGWGPLRWLVLACLAMAWVSFWFTVKRPLSHIFFLFFPLLMIYSCYCWNVFAADRRWRAAAEIFVVVAVLFQAGYAVATAPESSLYTDRARAVRAIEEKDYRILGERRGSARY